jgi:hypothetical protein
VLEEKKRRKNAYCGVVNIVRRGRRKGVAFGKKSDTKIDNTREPKEDGKKRERETENKQNRKIEK